jgi:hypothetical protein
MAGPYYVRSTDGSDASDGLSWANAKATLAGALAVTAAGERIWVSHVHAETQATSMTLTVVGTSASPIQILCGNDSAEPPTTLATTATITTTGTSNITLSSGSRYTYVYGITFSAGTGAGVSVLSNSASQWHLESCTLALGGDGASNISLGSDATQLTLTFRNVNVSFNNAAQFIRTRSQLLWDGGSVLGTAPTILIDYTVAAVSPGKIRLRGLDLSLVTGTLVDIGGAGPGSVSFEHCKLGAGVTLKTGAGNGLAGIEVSLDHCDSADTQYRMQRVLGYGEVSSETTIVRTGGATNGTTALAHKYVSASTAQFLFPFYGPEMVIWNNTTGSSKTITVEILHDSVTALDDDEIWLEVEYLGTSGFPQALFAKDRAADILATPAAQASSSVAWTTTGITNVNKQKLEVTVTPQEIGIFRARVALAKASYTVYVDPLLTVA